jgi:carbonic anhydrase
VPAEHWTSSLYAVVPQPSSSITQYQSVSHYAPGPYPATAAGGTAPAIDLKASMTAVVVAGDAITVTLHGEAGSYLGNELETLTQPLDEAKFASLESAVWSQDGQYLLFSDSEHAFLPNRSWDEDDRPDVSRLGRIYKWDAATQVTSVFLENAGTIGPPDDVLPEAPALADRKTAGAVGLAWGWETGELLVTQYAMRRVVMLNVQDVNQGEVAYEKVVPWSGSVSPNGDGSFNGPHNVFVANDVALFTDPPMGLELQSWDENGKELPFSWQTTDQLKAIAEATSINGVYAVDKDRSTQLIIDDIQMPHGVSWSHDRIFVSGSRAGTPSMPEQNGIFVYETERGDPARPWQSKMIDGSRFMHEGEAEGYFGSMALAGDVLLVAGPSGIYVVDSAKVELVGFVEFSDCFPVGIAVGNVAAESGKSYAFILTQCVDSGRPSLKRLEFFSPTEEDCGMSQSPVDLPACVSVPQPELSASWGEVQMSLLPLSRTPGTGLELSFDAPHWPPPSMAVDGMGYHLQKCMFSRSAHTITRLGFSSEQQELELQCVLAKDFSDRLGMLSLFFTASDQESAFLSQIQTMDSSGHSTALINFDMLFSSISDMSRYWSYQGSQTRETTATCSSENVDHYIIMEKVPMTSQQLDYFTGVALAARATQPLNERYIGGCFGQPAWYQYAGHEWAYSVQGHHVVCSQGTKQSPITLEYCPGSDRVSRSGIEANWGTQDLELANSGHSVVMTLVTPQQTNIEGTSYTLMQCFLHWGSEHFIDSRQQAVELQCVHAKDSMPGMFGVISLFLEGVVGSSNNNAFFGALGLPNMPSAAVTVNFDALSINSETHYWSYEGSFTTPPCTEVVDWFVLMDSRTVSDLQLESIKEAIAWHNEGGNFRPPQPLHERKVHGCNMHEWGYPYDESKWGGVCDTGEKQSPVDLRSCNHSDGSNLTRPHRLNFNRWQLEDIKVRLSNKNGVTLTPVGSWETMSGHESQEDNLYSMMSGSDMNEFMYKLEYCNVHWGSEHTVDGKQYGAEMHCVQRKSDAGSQTHGILGIFWDVGEESHPFWNYMDLEDHFPEKAEKALRHYPAVASASSLPATPATESVWATPGVRRLESSKSLAVPATLYAGISVEDEDGAPATLSAPDSVSAVVTVPLSGKIPGFIPAVKQIPSPAYTEPTLAWPSNYYPALVPAQVPALPATLQASGVDYTQSVTRSFPAAQAVMWGYPLEPSHGIARPYWLAGCHTLGKDECCSYLDGRHDQFYGEVCVVAAEGTFSTGNVCEPQCVVTGNCPWGAGSDEVVNVARCADQVEHWVNFALLFETLDLEHFWNYEGSLTTPPCSEVVDWYVLMEPARMSESQFRKLQLATGDVAANGNFRPPLPLHGRVPEGCTFYSSPWLDKVEPPHHSYPYQDDAWENSVMDAHAVCAVGTHQSPIDLDACVAKDQAQMVLGWGSQNVALALDHGIKITPSGSVSSTIQGTMYTLQHCEWHWGSEHTVDGHQHIMESHCIHTRGTTKRYGVVGIFWEVGGTSAFFEQIESSLPTVAAPAPEAMVGHISCSAEVMAENCSVCSHIGDGLCGSVGGDCEPIDDQCVLRRRNCGRGIHVQGYCADCPAGQCVSGNPSDDCMKEDETCQEIDPTLRPPSRRLTEEDSSIPITIPAVAGIGPGSFTFAVPATRVVPSTATASVPDTESVAEPGYVPGYVPTSNPTTLTRDGVEVIPSTSLPASSKSVPVSSTVPATVTKYQVMNWSFPLLPDNSVHRQYAPQGCTALNLDVCCFYMDGLRQKASDGLDPTDHEDTDDLNSLVGNAYGQPCRPARTDTMDWSCAPECWVTGDCTWYLGTHASREDEAGVCWDRFAEKGPSIDMSLLYSTLDLTRYWSYEGSWTTPPCSEVVDWFVLMDLAELSQTQVNMLEVATGMTLPPGNFRPPQPLYGRIVDGCTYHAERYKGTYANEEWAYYIEGAHSVCQNGSQQSPIHLTSCVDATERAPVITDWGVLDFQMSNNGYSVKLHNFLSLPSAVAATDIGGVHYTLEECNFHWGSEHFIDNLQHRMETQCVHKKTNDPGKYGVVALFYQVGEFPNAFLENIEDKLPSAQSDVIMVHDRSVDFDDLFTGMNMGHYWSYDGSFTTPPCTEGVDWYVLMDHAYMSEEQFGKIQMATGHAGGMVSANGNFRPPQPLNERPVLGCGRVSGMEDWSTHTADLYPYSAEAWASVVENKHALCKDGSRQSPINLDSCLSDPQPELNLPWGARDVVLRGTGEVTVTFLNTVHSTIKGADYILQECHFRSESEHQVDFQQFHLEMQCVHRQEQLGRYGVIAVLFHLGEWESEGNAFLGQLAGHLPLNSDDAQITLDFSSLLNMLDKTRYWSYGGSMTTPPCTEVVDWFVLMDSIEMSVSQLEVFKLAIGVPGGNFRTPQHLNDRPVVGCSRHADWYSADDMNWAYEVHDHHAICDHGLKQSPIDISVCAHVMDRPAMHLPWGTPSGTLSNDGRKVVFTLNQLSNALSVIVNKRYTLVECEFHWGSDHFVEGMQQRMEVHCVHAKQGHAGKYGIIGMFYNVGSVSNTFLTSLGELPSEGDARQLQSVGLQGLVDGIDLQHFWSYDGSLTMPPCTEAVDWYVLMDHAVMSSEQYEDFQLAIGWADPAGGNFRPPQPLNARHIDGCLPENDGDYTAMPENDPVDMCASGTEQSPIDLAQCTHREVDQMALVVEWGMQTVNIASTDGLKLELVAPETNPSWSPPKSILKGTEYKLLECSFYYHSSHTVTTNSFDLEIQCLHHGYEDTMPVRMGVVSIFFEKFEQGDQHNEFLDEFYTTALDQIGINFNYLWTNIDRTKYWDYKGSLTSSPCTEHVDWYVMMEVAKLSSTQLDGITSTIGGSGNFRLPQDLNGRAVGGCVPEPLLYPYHGGQWGDMNDVCSSGMMQSPINLTECAARLAQPEINMRLGTQEVEVMKTSRTVTLSVENPLLATMVGEVAYTLQHCEFHWGSEHFVENMQQRFEAQCVHTKVLDSSRDGVVAIFFEVGASEASNHLFFQPFEDSLMSTTGVNLQVNFDLLVAGLDARHYWSYEGSETTPPCAEVVDWYVMMDSSSLSPQQFDKFQMAIGWIKENGNFRPPQQLAGRGVVGCQDPDFVPEPTTTTTEPLPPYEEVHAGACMGGWLGTNLKTATVWGCHLACLDMPACGYFSYNDIDNTCARYSPFQRCPEDTGNKYPTYRSFRENRNIFENPREVSSYDTVHGGPCASGWLSSQNARMDTTDDCAQWCAGHLICRYFAFSSSSQMCSLYSAYSMCPARTDTRYAGTDWASYILYTVGEEIPPSAPAPEENLNFFFVHQGHCAAGWMSGHNTHVSSLEECVTKCFMTPTCGYISYSEHATTCSLYRGNARCPADNNYPDFASYRIAMV